MIYDMKNLQNIQKKKINISMEWLRKVKFEELQ